jgi:hypothetical protein
VVKRAIEKAPRFRVARPGKLGAIFKGGKLGKIGGGYGEACGEAYKDG